MEGEYIDFTVEILFFFFSVLFDYQKPYLA